jgi:acyl-homoserine-lactone acylase
MRRLIPTALSALSVLSVLPVMPVPSVVSAQSPRPYPDRVEIRRTAYGVPHILAEDLAALGFGLAWVQLEDYGDRVPVNLVRSRGELARYFGRDSIETDYMFRQTHARAVETYSLLDRATRELCEGFAAGTNRYVVMHPDAFPAWMPHDFTPQDVAALWVDETVEPATRVFLRAQAARRRVADSLRALGAGSNAWAFAPSRTTSGRAILLRNPHLNWNAGYYEAQITVPGVINFYGDFRIGYPLYFNGGFNEHLGWATTNNYPDLEEVYALDVDPDRPDHYLFDGGEVPVERVPVTVEWKNGDGLSSETREFWRTPLGPVVDREDGKVYVLRSPGWGEYRKTEQFLRMMRARNLEEWKAAVRMRAHTESNLTYADRDGNIFYVWNATLPERPGPSGHDTAAVPARTTDQIWTRIVPFDSLPQLLNPRGGYVQNANDPFHFTNLEAVLDSTRYPPPDFPSPALGLRSELSLMLVTERKKVSLDDVVRLKYSYRMLAAERFKDDLLAAVRAANPSPAALDAAALLERWDDTVSPESRGSTLFEIWYRRYTAPDSGDSRRFDERSRTLFAKPWSPAAPIATPDGLADPERAARLFTWAIEETARRFGRVDVAWGDVHRMRVGDLDLPLGGCTGALGCFRVIWYEDAPDGKQVAMGGDGWILAVEFRKQGPRAVSVLAYGESDRPDSPHHTDQAAMFARGELKSVAFTEDEIAAKLERRYRPGR